MDQDSRLSADEREVVRRFAELYWRRRKETFVVNRWLGVPTWKHPFDAWITQELIVETRPEVIVESGSFAGGSALLWAGILEHLQSEGKVVAIDVRSHTRYAEQVPLFHRRVEWIEGSSTDSEVVAEVYRRCKGGRCMVILDSDHTADHVEAELHAYADLVAPGCYMIVEDGFVSALMPEHGPGPLEGLERFLASDDRFEADEHCERMLHTLNPRGYLRRVR